MGQKVSVLQKYRPLWVNNKKGYIAGGCFWGMEDLFRVRPGVLNTEVGYQGGVNDNPTYRNHPGHAEGIEITYDSDVTSFRKLLDFFFTIHTRPNFSCFCILYGRALG